MIFCMGSVESLRVKLNVSECLFVYLIAKEMKECARGREVVDEDTSALGEGEESILVEDHVFAVR